MAVARALHVELHQVRPGPRRGGHRRQRVLGGDRAVTPVRDDQHVGGADPGVGYGGRRRGCGERKPQRHRRREHDEPGQQTGDDGTPTTVRRGGDGSGHAARLGAGTCPQPDQRPVGSSLSTRPGQRRNSTLRCVGSATASTTSISAPTGSASVAHHPGLHRGLGDLQPAVFRVVTVGLEHDAGEPLADRALEQLGLDQVGHRALVARWPGARPPASWTAGRASPRAPSPGRRSPAHSATQISSA